MALNMGKNFLENFWQNELPRQLLDTKVTINPFQHIFGRILKIFLCS
jgi:hypothetical protein